MYQGQSKISLISLFSKVYLPPKVSQQKLLYILLLFLFFSLHLFYNFEEQNHPQKNLFTSSRSPLPFDKQSWWRRRLTGDTWESLSYSYHGNEINSASPGISQLASFSPSLAPVLVLDIFSESPKQCEATHPMRILPHRAY